MNSTNGTAPVKAKSAFRNLAESYGPGLIVAATVFGAGSIMGDSQSSECDDWSSPHDPASLGRSSSVV